MQNRIVDLKHYASKVSNLELFSSVLKSIGFVEMVNNSDKLEYVNKLPNNEYEKQYLTLISKRIDNSVAMFENSNFLNNIDIETIIESFSDELLEIFASVIEDYRNANCLHLLKHELEIIYHLQDFLKIFDQDEGCISMIMNGIRGISNNFVVDAIVKSGLRTLCTCIGHAMLVAITIKTNINRNHMLNPPSRVSHGFNQLLLRNQDYCITHKNKTSKDYSCVSHVNYIATKIRNRNAKLIAQVYIQQCAILGMEATTGFLKNNTNREKTALMAQNLRKKQKAWLCYYCQEWNKSGKNFCDFCKKGLNPLYFSKENKSKWFTVDPDKFGIFKAQSTSNYKNVKFFLKYNDNYNSIEECLQFLFRFAWCVY